MKKNDRDSSSIEDLLQSLSDANVPESFERSIDGLFSKHLQTVNQTETQGLTLRSQWRNFIMRRKYEFALTTIFFFIVIAVMQFNQTQSSLADTFEKVRSATSMIMIMQMGQNGEYPHSITVYWKTPNLIRINKGSENDFQHQNWWLDGKTATLVDHKEQSATVLKNPKPDHPVAGKQYKDTLKFSTPEGVLSFFSDDCKKTGSIKEDGNVLDVYTGTPADFGPEEKRQDTKLTAYIDTKSHFPKRIEIRDDIDKERGTYGCIKFDFFWNDRIAEDIFKPVIPKNYKYSEIDSNQTAEPLAIKPGEGVGDLKLRMSRDQVIELWGEPDAIFERSHHFDNLLYEDFQYYKRGIIISILPEIGVGQIKCLYSSLLHYAVFLDFTGETPQGVRIGMSEQEIIKRMGEPAKRVETTYGSTHLIQLQYPNNVFFRLMSGYFEKEKDLPHVVLIGVQSEDCPLDQG